MTLRPREITYSPGFSSAFITVHRIPARIAVGLGTVYFSNKGTFTHKMQAFWKHMQHTVAIYKVKVNTKNDLYDGMRFPRGGV